MSFQFPSRRGQDHPLSRLSNAARMQARADYRAGRRTITDLARDHGMSKGTMHRIVHQPADWLGESDR